MYLLKKNPTRSSSHLQCATMTHQTSRKPSDVGYETRTRRPMYMGIEERQVVPMSQTRPRENIHILSKASHKDRLAIPTSTKPTSSGPKSGAEQRVVGTQEPTDKQSHSNGVGTRLGGAYHSSDKNIIFGNRNGNRFGQDAARGPNLTTNSTPADGMEHYRVNVGYVDVRFMCGKRKGFNVARGIKQ
jgi:hypothetical protein